MNKNVFSSKFQLYNQLCKSSLDREEDKSKEKKEFNCNHNFWDIVVITSANDQQTKLYQSQIEIKKKTHCIPQQTDYIIFQDKPGFKNGSGGATLSALSNLYDKYENKLFQKRILIIHSGGSSQRLPHHSATGKLFANLPIPLNYHQSESNSIKHDQDVSSRYNIQHDWICSMFEMTLIMLINIVQKLPLGTVFISCADVILSFDTEKTSNELFNQSGFTAFAIPNTFDIAVNHGVFVLDTNKEKEKIDDDRIHSIRCERFLHKPSKETLENLSSKIAINDHSQTKVFTDSVFYFDYKTADMLIQYYKNNHQIFDHCETDCYGDFLQPLGTNPTKEYIDASLNTNRNLLEARTSLFNLLSGTPLNAIIFPKQERKVNSINPHFHHLGTMKEYISHFTSWNSHLGKEREQFPYLIDDLELSNLSFGSIPHSIIRKCNNSRIMHSIVDNSKVSIEDNSIIESCHISIPIHIGKQCILSNLQLYNKFDINHFPNIDQRLINDINESVKYIPDNTFLMMVPISGFKTYPSNGFACIIFSIIDDIKANYSSSHQTAKWLNRFLTNNNFVNQQLKYFNLENLWNNDNNQTLWYAKLFPVFETPIESFLWAMKTLHQENYTMNDIFSIQPISNDLFSASEIMENSNRTSIMEFHRHIETIVISDYMAKSLFEKRIDVRKWSKHDIQVPFLLDCLRDPDQSPLRNKLERRFIKHIDENYNDSVNNFSSQNDNSHRKVLERFRMLRTLSYFLDTNIKKNNDQSKHSIPSYLSLAQNLLRDVILCGAINENLQLASYKEQEDNTNNNNRGDLFKIPIESFLFNSSRDSYYSKMIAQKFEHHQKFNHLSSIFLGTQHMSSLKSGDTTCVQLPARINLAGGWSDTPPYTFEKGGAVLNVAVTLEDQLPLFAQVQLINEPILIVESKDKGRSEKRTVQDFQDLFNYNDTSDPFALHKAVLSFCLVPHYNTLAFDHLPKLKPICDILKQKNFGYGIHLSTRVNTPRGSGLGVSSILILACLRCIRLLGQGKLGTFNHLNSVPNSSKIENLEYNSVLTIEQMMTTCGGWQDQIGGGSSGMKLIQTPANCCWPYYQLNLLPKQVSERLNERLLVIYTGVPRLAKPVLSDVVGNNILGMTPNENNNAHHTTINSTTEALQSLAELARNMSQQFEDIIANQNHFESQDFGFKEIGNILSQVWELNQFLSPRAITSEVQQIFEVIDEFVEGSCIIGAGGGGYIVGITKLQFKGKMNEIDSKLKQSLAQKRGLHQDQIDSQVVNIKICN